MDQSIGREGFAVCCIPHPHPRSCGTSLRKTSCNLKIIQSQSSPKYPTSFSLYMLFIPALLKRTLLSHMTYISWNENYPCRSPTQLTVSIPGWQNNLIHVESFSIRWLYSSVKLKLVNLKKNKRSLIPYLWTAGLALANGNLMARDRPVSRGWQGS